MPAAFFGNNVVGRKRGAKTIDDEPLRASVGLGNKIEIAFQLEADAARGELREKRSGLGCDGGCGFNVRRQTTRPPKGI